MKLQPDPKQFGLRPGILEKLNSLFISHPEIDTVVLYGSRAKGTYHPGSDIDITIKSEHCNDSLVGIIGTRKNCHIFHKNLHFRPLEA